MVHCMMECVDNLKESTDAAPKEEDCDGLTEEKQELKVENHQIAANFASYLTYLYQHSLAANLLHNTSNSKNNNLNSDTFQQYLSKLLLLKNLANPLAHHQGLSSSDARPLVKFEDSNANTDGEVLDLKCSPSPNSADTSSSCYSDSYPNYSTCSSPGPEDLRVNKSSSSPVSESWLKHDNLPNANHSNCSTTKLHNFKLDQNFCSTQDIARMIAAELRHYGIPQAVFSQKVLGRSQGTLSDLLRNPKPWNKLKAGKETFRRMLDWLNQTEEQRLAMLKYTPIGSHKFKSSRANTSQSTPPSTALLSASSTTCITPPSTSTTSLTTANMDEGHQEQMQLDLSLNNNSSNNNQKPSRKPRLVFTEIQRRTLMAIFKEVKRPSRDVQITIAEQLNLKLSTVSNFFMNARRRSLDKFTSPDSTNHEDSENINKNINIINNSLNNNISNIYNETNVNNEIDDGNINDDGNMNDNGGCDGMGEEDDDANDNDDDNDANDDDHDDSCNTPVDFSIKEELI